MGLGKELNFTRLREAKKKDSRDKLVKKIPVFFIWFDIVVVSTLSKAEICNIQKKCEGKSSNEFHIK